MHDPRVLLDPATDAVRRLARRGYALDTSALEKLLSVAQLGDPARATRRGPRPSGWPPRCKSADADARPALVERARELKGVTAAAEEEHRTAEAELQELLLGIPNLPSDDSPDGATEDDARLIRTWGEPAAFDFTPLDHVDLGERLGILDLAAGHQAGRPAVRGAARPRRRPGAGHRPVLPRPAHRSPRLHRVRGAHAGQPGDDDRHRAAAQVRAGPVQDRGGRPGAVPDPHRRGAADQPARQGDPRRSRTSRWPTPRTPRASARRPAPTARTPAG